MSIRWEVKSMDEAMEWVMRAPDPCSGEECDIELRPFIAPLAAETSRY
jgi:hypothetical protein